MPFTYKYPRPSVTVDCAVFTFKSKQAHILLIQRGNFPFEGKWALPGGFVDMDEELEDAAIRELEEETTLKIQKLEQLKTYGAIGRDPRGRTISVVYWGVAKSLAQVEGRDDAKNAKWFALNSLPSLAFDHDEIVKFAISKLKDEYSFQQDEFAKL